MKIVLLVAFTTLLLSDHTPPPCLCQATETTIYSFATTKSKKILSVCAGKDHSYLIYRYGLPQKIELQFPEVADSKSWQQFVYKGYSRAGGPQNAALSDQSLSFTNQDATYEVYDAWSYADRTEKSYTREAGIRIVTKGKVYDSRADLRTISGSLENLTQYTPIENRYGQD